MSTYRLFVYEKGPQKALKEPEIYEGAKGRKYLRVREGGQDSMISLKTTSITEAIKLREARQKAKTAAELGVAVEPKQAAKKAKAALTTVRTVVIKDTCRTVAQIKKASHARRASTWMPNGSVARY